MKIKRYFSIAAIFILISPILFAEEKIPSSSCESYIMDLNSDNLYDIVLLVKKGRMNELVVLIGTQADGYKSYTIDEHLAPDLVLSCHYGKTVRETVAGRSKGIVYNTGGAYIKLSQPEGGSMVYFWDGKGFKRIWTAD
jgi:hypothetical protein